MALTGLTRMMIMQRISLPIVAALLAACGSVPKSSPDFTATAYGREKGYHPQYLLGPGDTVEINVLSAPELSRTVTIAPDGTVRIPLSGSIVAAGLTPDELSVGLMAALSKELRNPDIEIIATDFASQRIFVGGSVGQPAILNCPAR